MPFLREINPANGIRAGIWHITETAGELHALLSLNNLESALYATFRHELLKRQWLACRALLKHILHPLATNISYNPHGKPFLDSGSHQISVSHAGEFAAVVCSENIPVGIDIEKMRDRVSRVKDRFLQKSELESLREENHLAQLHILWGGKEALYKLTGNPHVDFRNDIYIHPFDYLCNKKRNCKATVTVNGSSTDFTLFFQTIDDYIVVVAF